MLIRGSTDGDIAAMLAIINEAARAYRGVIPEDRWHEPYMSMAELEREIADGVRFWVAEEDSRVLGVMGIQDKGDVALVRHAYVATAVQRSGIGANLLRHVEGLVDKPILIGTWATASWAIRFYQRNGFRLLATEEKDRLLRRYWSIPERQVETSVVLANERWVSARPEVAPAFDSAAVTSMAAASTRAIVEAPTLPTPTCLNCNAPLAGAYCSNCGQRARTGRITFPGLFRSLASQVLSVDSHLLRTFRALVHKPGAFVRDFVLGRRGGYARPLPYYLLVVAFNIVVSVVIDRSLGQASDGPEESFWEQNFLALQIGLAYGLVMVPLAAARRVLHRQAGYSVAEHFVFLIYVLAQSILIVLAAQVVLWPLGRPLTGDAEGVIWLVAFSAYVVWGSRGFLAEPSWKVALKLLPAYGMVIAAAAVVGLLIQQLSK